jgi:rhomboid protease GluP
MDEFPQITKETKFKEEGMELFIKLTDDIGKKNENNQKQAELLFTQKDPIVTKILLIINFIVFLLSILLGQDFIISMGSNHRDSVLSGQIYRLISAGFIHVDVIHFLCNMYALYVLGPQIENFYGKIKYLIIYFGSIIIASLLSLVFLKDYVSFGASGAIFGLLGSLLYFGYHYRVYLDGVIKSQIIPIIMLNLFLGFVLNGIDNAGHIGGLIGGILLSMACGVQYKSKKQSRFNGINLTLIFTAFLIVLLFMA